VEGMKARRIISTAVLAGLVAGLGATPAHAAKGPNTFEGSCTLTGKLVFAVPLGNDLRTTTFTDTASGTCKGTLNGVPSDAIPVVNSVSGSATLSCLAGHSMSADTLTFARHYPIKIVTEAAGGLTQFVAYSKGVVSGEAAVEVNFLPYFDESTQAACQAGTLTSARYDLVARTITPLVG
jgi:hypothetical protein